MYFEISRAYVAGKPMTAEQRTSSLFSEEPTVLGKALRRGLPPIMVSEEQFDSHEVELKRLWDAGAINILAVDGHKKVDFSEHNAVKKMAQKIPSAADELEAMLASPAPSSPEEKQAIVAQHEADRKAELAAGDSQPPMQEEQKNVPPADASSFDDKTEVVHAPHEAKKPHHKEGLKKGRKE